MVRHRRSRSSLSEPKADAETPAKPDTRNLSAQNTIISCNPVLNSLFRLPTLPPKLDAPWLGRDILYTNFGSGQGFSGSPHLDVQRHRRVLEKDKLKRSQSRPRSPEQKQNNGAPSSNNTGTQVNKGESTNKGNGVNVEKLQNEVNNGQPLQYVTSERLIQLKNMVDTAVRDHKVYVMSGTYRAVRKALRDRGWIEKLDSDTKPWRRTPINLDDPLSLLAQNTVLSDNAKVSPDGLHRIIEASEAEVINRMLRNISEDLCWLNHPYSYNWKQIRKYEYINRLPTAYFANKIGLSNALHYIQWFLEPGVAATQFPRTYNISCKEELDGFVDDFRLTACISTLKWLTTKYRIGGPKMVKSSTGKVDYYAIEFALRRCAEFIKSKEHEDIDKDEDIEISNEQWEHFLTLYYQLVNENAMLKELDYPSVKTIVLNAHTMLNLLRPHWPQCDIDGMMSLWILKPGYRCCGSGIVIKNRLEEVLTTINPALNRGNRYVVQKYIERPLLIYKTKFDIRQWFLVIGVHPLSIWMYKECYLRFCSHPFNLKNTHESIHLSNNAVQRKYRNPKKDKALPEQNMWDNTMFKDYLKGIGQPNAWDDIIYPGMKRGFIGAVLASQDSVDRKKNCFQLFGADFMISENILDGPWLIEINSCPAMDSSTKITARLCPQVMEDMVKVVIDRNTNLYADTGMFELVFKQSVPPPLPPLDHNLIIRGAKLIRINPKVKEPPKKNSDKTLPPQKSRPDSDAERSEDEKKLQKLNSQQKLPESDIETSDNEAKHPQKIAEISRPESVPESKQVKRKLELKKSSNSKKPSLSSGFESNDEDKKLVRKKSLKKAKGKQTKVIKIIEIAKTDAQKKRVISLAITDVESGEEEKNNLRKKLNINLLKKDLQSKESERKTTPPKREISPPSSSATASRDNKKIDQKKDPTTPTVKAIEKSKSTIVEKKSVKERDPYNSDLESSEYEAKMNKKKDQMKIVDKSKSTESEKKPQEKKSNTSRPDSGLETREWARKIVLKMNQKVLGRGKSSEVERKLPVSDSDLDSSDFEKKFAQSEAQKKVSEKNKPVPVKKNFPGKKLGMSGPDSDSESSNFERKPTQGEVQKMFIEKKQAVVIDTNIPGRKPGIFGPDSDSESSDFERTLTQAKLQKSVMEKNKAVLMKRSTLEKKRRVSGPDSDSESSDFEKTLAQQKLQKNIMEKNKAVLMKKNALGKKLAISGPDSDLESSENERKLVQGKDQGNVTEKYTSDKNRQMSSSDKKLVQKKIPNKPIPKNNSSQVTKNSSEKNRQTSCPDSDLESSGNERKLNQGKIQNKLIQKNKASEITKNSSEKNQQISGPDSDLESRGNDRKLVREKIQNNLLQKTKVTKNSPENKQQFFGLGSDLESSEDEGNIDQKNIQNEAVEVTTNSSEKNRKIPSPDSDLESSENERNINQRKIQNKLIAKSIPDSDLESSENENETVQGKEIIEKNNAVEVERKFSEKERGTKCLDKELESSEDDETVHQKIIQNKALDESRTTDYDSDASAKKFAMPFPGSDLESSEDDKLFLQKNFYVNTAKVKRNLNIFQTNGRQVERKCEISCPDSDVESSENEKEKTQKSFRVDSDIESSEGDRGSIPKNLPDPLDKNNGIPENVQRMSELSQPESDVETSKNETNISQKEPQKTIKNSEESDFDTSEEERKAMQKKYQVLRQDSDLKITENERKAIYMKYAKTVKKMLESLNETKNYSSSNTSLHNSLSQNGFFHNSEEEAEAKKMDLIKRKEDECRKSRGESQYTEEKEFTSLKKNDGVYQIPGVQSEMENNPSNVNHTKSKDRQTFLDEEIVRNLINYSEIPDGNLEGINTLSRIPNDVESISFVSAFDQANYEKGLVKDTNSKFLLTFDMNIDHMIIQRSQPIFVNTSLEIETDTQQSDSDFEKKFMQGIKQVRLDELKPLSEPDDDYVECKPKKVIKTEKERSLEYFREWKQKYDIMKKSCEDLVQAFKDANPEPKLEDIIKKQKQFDEAMDAKKKKFMSNRSETPTRKTSSNDSKKIKKKKKATVKDIVECLLAMKNLEKEMYSTISTKEFLHKYFGPTLAQRIKKIEDMCEKKNGTAELMKKRRTNEKYFENRFLISSHLPDINPDRGRSRSPSTSKDRNRTPSPTSSKRHEPVIDYKILKAREKDPKQKPSVVMKNNPSSSKKKKPASVT